VITGEEDLLRDVVDHAAPAQVLADVAAHRGLVQPHEVREGLGRPRAGLLDQRRLGLSLLHRAPRR
jgi:hypothetical protein